MQQELLSKLNRLERTKQNTFKTIEKKSTQDLIKIEKKIYAPHRVKPFETEIWKSNKTNEDKELIIFMPGLGGEINNFKWIGNHLKLLISPPSPGIKIISSLSSFVLLLFHISISKGFTR